MKIALWQTTPLHDPQQALIALEQMAQRARAQGADLMLTPEATLGGYNVDPDRCKSLAASADTLIEALKSIVRAHEIALVVDLALPGPDRPYNGAVVLDAAGVERLRYHKTHLLFAMLDRTELAAKRRYLNHRADRRPDLYSYLVVEGLFNE